MLYVIVETAGHPYTKSTTNSTEALILGFETLSDDQSASIWREALITDIHLAVIDTKESTAMARYSSSRLVVGETSLERLLTTELNSHAIHTNGAASP